MGAQPRRLAILSFVVSVSAIGLECASAEECDYKTCGALMARDASVSWAISGRHDYSSDTKRACAEFNACVRHAKNNSAGRAAAAPTAGSSSLKSSSKDSTTVLKPQPADRQAKDMQPASPPAQGPATQPATSVTVGNSPATIGSILRASCGPDVQRLCAGARRESEALKCLDSQRMELSPTCSLYFEKMGAQPTAQRNAPNKKPASPPTTQIPVQKKKPPSQPPTTSIPVQENAPNEQPLSPPPIAPNRAQENAPSKKPTSPPPVQENAPNKKPQPPPTTPIPD
jgi:hypothetical protein